MICPSAQMMRSARSLTVSVTLYSHAKKRRKYTVLPHGESQNDSWSESELRCGDIYTFTYIYCIYIYNSTEG